MRKADMSVFQSPSNRADKGKGNVAEPHRPWRGAQCRPGSATPFPAPEHCREPPPTSADFCPFRGAS